ncbi:MAG: hypothetical protein A2878_01175 [Candidatus Moranbacteria bacterium RIFCSPHIGHO2_01_FULL_54_31]|nr:MAG: hypothetical protein A2878_01175 [Candidatus Moranbacteria bacterium RIFCSPHIGHO2_01_FULL_54_31]
MPRFSSKQWALAGLVVIIGLGLFLRSYHFSDWLHFELDQARDARVVDDGLRGDVFDLPLLGPKAGGTSLRLAPGFYYLEYGSALVFGETPAGMAAFVMMLSVLAIPLFYAFVRRYFPTKLALGLALLFAVSEYLVMYGRFAWNPNLIPFFVLLGCYALLRSVDHEEPRRGRWFVFSVFAFALATQFHFLAFVALPVILAAFLIIRRPKFSWKAWAGALAVVCILYLPLALNEAATGGTNTRAFFEAVTGKSTKSEHSLAEKALRDASVHALNGLVVTTGFEGGTFPAITLEGGLAWKCDARCDAGKWSGITATLLLGWSLLALAWFWWKEPERRKSDFLLLSGIWFSVTFALFLPLAYDIVPRFFLLSAPLFFILIGLIVLSVKKLFGGRKIGEQIAMIAIGLLAASNLSSLLVRFDEIARSTTEAVDSPPDRILKERIRVPLAQQNAIIDFLGQRSRETGYPVYMWSEPQHRRALKYLMERRGIENAVLGYDGIYREGVYYLILRAQSDLEDALQKYRVSYTVGETTSFGTLVAIELVPKPEAIIGERPDPSVPKPPEIKVSPRYTWREFFSRDFSKQSAAQSEVMLEQTEDAAVHDDQTQ